LFEKGVTILSWLCQANDFCQAIPLTIFNRTSSLNQNTSSSLGELWRTVYTYIHGLYEARQGHKVQMVPNNRVYVYVYGPYGGRYDMDMLNTLGQY
jgi:hypothetical protein